MLTLKDLSTLDHAERCKNTSMPPAYIPTNRYTDKNANGLTKAVIRFLVLHNHQAERISTTGRVIDDRKPVTNVLGQNGLIGSTKYIPGTGTKGSADVSSTIFGRSVKWEVKMKDKQSLAQVKYQQDIERAGGKYFVIHNWEEFYNYYIQLIQNL